MDFKKQSLKVYKYEQNVIGRGKDSRNPCTEHDFWHVGADVVDRSLSDLDDRLAFIADGISRMLYRGCFIPLGPVPLSRMPLGKSLVGDDGIRYFCHHHLSEHCHTKVLFGH